MNSIIYRNTILCAFFYGPANWSLTLREEMGRVWEQKVRTAEHTVMYMNDYRWGLDWRSDLLTILKHVTTHNYIAPPLIFTLYKSQQHTLSLLQSSPGND
jgi:hypothetical protein